jgi:ATP-dependent protease HslVU (ClpYQ) peptidase subunit
VTTIVVDKEIGYMAADHMVTTNDGEVCIRCDTKIEEVNIGGDHYLVGAAGMEGPAEHFLEWFREGDWDDPPSPWESLDDEYDFTVVILGPDGIQVVDKFMRMIPIHHRWYAAGSGGPYAWAILEAGCGIDKAMATALRMDPNSGFGYQVRYRDPESRGHNRDVD